MRAMNELFGTVAVLTGASSGIGRAEVERLFNAGCSIAAFADEIAGTIASSPRIPPAR
jgi:NAD(P)-dependent dehydrogenase (short-subunit alcohol dehydrogenase family)